jgi:hypothetical protein
MAVGISIGATFGKMVSSLVEDILRPLSGLLPGRVDFSSLFLTLSGASYPYAALTMSEYIFSARSLLQETARSPLDGVRPARYEQTRLRGNSPSGGWKMVTRSAVACMQNSTLVGERLRQLTVGGGGRWSRGVRSHACAAWHSLACSWQTVRW